MDNRSIKDDSYAKRDLAFFSSGYIKSIDTIYSDDCETWTDGTCLFIDYYTIKIPKYI